MNMINLTIHYVENIRAVIHNHDDFQVLHLEFSGTNYKGEPLTQEIAVHCKDEDFSDEVLSLSLIHI